MEATILIVDDVPANRNLLAQTLEPQGCELLLAPDGQTACDLARRAKPDLILLDVMMPGLNGYETCRRLKADAATSGIPIIFITAQHETPSVVEGFRAGGVDYITKPFQMEEVLARVETHLQISRLTRAVREKNAELEAELGRRRLAEAALATADEQISLLSRREAERWGVSAFIGESAAFARVVGEIRKVQQAGNLSVLITGESGTGKELIARAIHFGGLRARGPFVAVNCTAIPKDLAESAFFGHRRGAFSGAHADQKGFFEQAHGGTLFLDEIGDMPVPAQAKLLRVLEDGLITPVGGAQEKRVEVRVVAASNADFSAKIAGGGFRQDLYFRLARLTVNAPPLRERPGDIPLLAAHFARGFATEMGRPTAAISAVAMRTLTTHPYPGNVRELRNLIERALIESGGGEIKPEHLRFVALAPANRAAPAAPAMPANVPADLPLNLEQAERVLLQRALAQTQGNVSKAAELLGVNRARIYRMQAQEATGENPSGSQLPGSC